MEHSPWGIEHGAERAVYPIKILEMMANEKCGIRVTSGSS